MNVSISYKNVLNKFKEIFFEKIATLAVTNAFSSDNFDLEKHLTDALTVEKLEEAIMGHTMIEAFSEIIRRIPVNTAISMGIKRDKIFQLEKNYRNNFLEKGFYPSVVKRSMDSVLREYQKASNN